ncbi:MAG: hypothetical protein PHY16_19125 [Methylobacter sp.]|nr:hypothetical protein [Methylobacter sp.]
MTDQADEPIFIQYLCYLKSAPGMWSHYEGYVAVFAPDDAEEHDIFAWAVRQLSQTSFKDRPSLSSWRLERIEKA